MKKVLCIELSYGWVLSRIDDSKFPIEMLKDKLLRASKFTVVSESYVHLTLEMDEKDVEKTKSKVTSFFTQKYGKDSIEALTFSDQDVVSNIDDDEDDVYGEDTTANDEGSTPLGNTLEKNRQTCRRKGIQGFCQRDCESCAYNKEKTFARRVCGARLSVFHRRRMRTFDVSRIVCNACRGAGACVDSGVFIRRGNKTRFDEQACRRFERCVQRT